MAYQVWSVVFGEQPSASKWNILGTNDAEFNSLIQRLSGGLVLLDSSGNEIIKGIRTASAVNEVQVTNNTTTNAPIIEATGGDTNIHLVVRAKGNGLLKTSVLRQDDTTNTYKHNSVILTGWGVLAIATGSRTFTDTVTFGITFAQRPIVVSTAGGDNTSNTGYGGGANTISADWQSKATNISTTGYVQYLVSVTNVGGNGFAWYQWIAIGELT